jgi:RimJ/RimL family protein N-acetyltransferase
MIGRLTQDAHGGPVLETARLRKPQSSDLPGFTAFWTSPRTVFMGGPWTPEDAAAEFPDLTRQWAQHGFSLFVMTLLDIDRPIGLAGPFFPEGHPEPELAWNLWDAADAGQGLATEASRAARDWFFAASAHKTAVSYIHPGNAASHRMCERLGAKVDRDAACPYPPPVDVYRHDAKALA